MKGLNLRVVLLLLGILSVSLFISMQQIKEGFGVMGSPTTSNLTDSTTPAAPVIPPASTAPAAPVTPASTTPAAPVTPVYTAPHDQETGPSHMVHSTSPTQVVTIAPPNTFNPEKFAKGLSAIATVLIDSVQGMGNQQPFTTLYSAYP